MTASAGGTASRPWVRPRQTPDQRAAELRELERLATRDRRRDLLAALVEMAVAVGVGLYLLGWSMHTTDGRAAGIALHGGLALAQAGVLLALVRARLRAERRGDTW